MFELNEEGILVQDGEPVKLQGQVVKLDGYLSKDKVNSVVSERLAREQKTLKDQIKALEAQATRTPELERMLEESRQKLQDLERQASQAKQTAEAEVASRLARAEKRAKDLEDALSSEKAARLTEQVSAQIVAAAKDRWIDPVSDLVPKLMASHKREVQKGQDGKPDTYEDLFEVTRRDEKGNTVKEFLPLADAIGALESREEFHHYLRASAREGGGAPGSKHFNPSNYKRSEMSNEDKSAFVAKHGVEAFQALPE